MGWCLVGVCVHVHVRARIPYMSYYYYYNLCETSSLNIYFISVWIDRARGAFLQHISLCSRCRMCICICIYCPWLQSRILCKIVNAHTTYCGRSRLGDKLPSNSGWVFSLFNFRYVRQRTHSVGSVLRDSSLIFPTSSSNVIGMISRLEFHRTKKLPEQNIPFLVVDCWELLQFELLIWAIIHSTICMSGIILYRSVLWMPKLWCVPQPLFAAPWPDHSNLSNELRIFIWELGCARTESGWMANKKKKNWQQQKMKAKKETLTARTHSDTRHAKLNGFLESIFFFASFSLVGSLLNTHVLSYSAYVWCTPLSKWSVINFKSPIFIEQSISVCCGSWGRTANGGGH